MEGQHKAQEELEPKGPGTVFLLSDFTTQILHCTGLFCVFFYVQQIGRFNLHHLVICAHIASLAPPFIPEQKGET